MITNKLKKSIMASVNKVILIGNVGKDPEIKQLENGSRIAKFSLAIPFPFY